MDKKCPKHGFCEFKLEKQNKNYSRWRCVKCAYNRQMKYYKNTKIKLVEACGGECKICGYSRCMNAMEFHHLDREKKEFKLSRKISLKRRLKEAKKCLLVCCRCHREIEAGMVSVVETVCII